MALPFLKKVENDYILTAPKAVVYVPLYFFDNEKIATTEGDVLKTIGFVFIEVYKTLTSKPDLYQMDCPLRISIPFSESKKEKKNFKGSRGEDDFMAFTVEGNSVMIQEALNVQNGKNSELFMNFLLGGKLPENLKYSDIALFLKEVSIMNGTSLGVPMSVVEAMVGEMCRSAKDIYTPYRKIAGRTGDENGYMNIRIQELPRVTSTFSGIAFEDVTSAVSVGCVAGKKGIKGVETPFEKVIHC